MAEGTVSTTPHGDDGARNNTSNTDNSQPSGSGTTLAQENTKTAESHHYSCCQDKPAPKWWYRIDWSQVVLDLLLLAVGIKLAFIYSGQLDQMIESNKISRESLTSVQRAFLSFSPLKITRIQAPGNQHEHSWSFDNVAVGNEGSTSAVNAAGMVLWGQLIAEPSESQFIGSYSQFPYMSVPPKGTRGIPVMPGSIPETTLFTTDMGPIISEKSTHESRFIGQNVFIWGWVFYRDVFPGTDPHVIEFCSVMAHPRYSADFPGAHLAFAFPSCQNHNCEDKECKDYETIVNAVEKRILK